MVGRAGGCKVGEGMAWDVPSAPLSGGPRATE